MNEYILFMHDDVAEREIANDDARWDAYISGLIASGQFDGGSAMGKGVLFKKSSGQQSPAVNMTGYVRVRAENIEAAQRFLQGNPNYEAGATVEIRELLKT